MKDPAIAATGRPDDRDGRDGASWNLVSGRGRELPSSAP